MTTKSTGLDYPWFVHVNDYEIYATASTSRKECSNNIFPTHVSLDSRYSWTQAFLHWVFLTIFCANGVSYKPGLNCITDTLYNCAVKPLSQETIYDLNQSLVLLKVRKSVCHGHAFEGSAQKLLHSLDDEEFRMLLGYTTHFTALRYFVRLVTAAFGIERADNWEEILEDSQFLYANVKDII